MGPRFLITMLPFLACPLALALQALPGPDDRAGGRLDRRDGDRHDHPSAGRLRERDGRLDALAEQGLIPADDRHAPSAPGAAGAAIWPFLLAAGGGVAARRAATPRLRLTRRGARRRPARAARLGAVRRARADRARDRPPGPAQHRRRRRHTALNLKLHDGVRYPLTHAGALLRARRRRWRSAAMWLARRERWRRRERRRAPVPAAPRRPRRPPAQSRVSCSRS